jgi:glutamate mutase epsilon subunit
MEQVERVNSRESNAKSNLRIHNSEKKLPPAEFYHRNQYMERKDEAMQFDFDQ